MIINGKTTKIAQDTIQQLSPELKAVQQSAKKALDRDIVELEKFINKMPELQANQNALIKTLEQLAKSVRLIKK